MRRRLVSRARRTRRPRASHRSSTALRIRPGSAGGGRTGAGRAGANASPRDVALSVLGVPPSHTVIAWEDATIGGFALTRQIDEPSRRRLAARIAAIVAAGTVRARVGGRRDRRSHGRRSRRVASCFVAPDTASGTRARAAALPVRLRRRRHRRNHAAIAERRRAGRAG